MHAMPRQPFWTGYPLPHVLVLINDLHANNFERAADFSAFELLRSPLVDYCIELVSKLEHSRFHLTMNLDQTFRGVIRLELRTWRSRIFAIQSGFEQDNL